MSNEDGHRCPYHEHLPQTVEGWQAWDLVTRFGSQVRTAGLGGVIGFDRPALLAEAERMEYDTRAISFLLPFLESVLVDSMRKEDHGGTDGIDPVDGQGR